LGIAENAAEINRRVSEALQRSGDPSCEVKLISVSKTFPPARISEAMDAGLFRFGENRVQELASKYDELSDRKTVRIQRGKTAPVEWHFIGHLQTNKIKRLLDVPTRYIHSVDRVEVAVELDRQLQKRGESREILVEVNTSGEASKSGVEPEKAAGLVREIAVFGTLKVKGLMTIGALTEDKAAVRGCFSRLKDVFLKVREEGIDGVEMNELSMGMSGDFELAVEEGATIIRVGTAIFGERPIRD
jgi:PLP dependent protein